MGNSRYDKDLSVFDRLSKFAQTTIVKDEKKALQNETDLSVMNAAKFTAALENQYTPTDDEQLMYLKMAQNEGFSFRVKDNSYVFEELSDEERNTFTGTRYVQDRYDEVTLQVILSDTAKYGNVFIRDSDTVNGFLYSKINLVAANSHDRLFVKRKNNTTYKAISYHNSLEYSIIFKSNDDKKNMEILTDSDGHLNIFNGDVLTHTRFSAVVAYQHIEISSDNVKLPLNTYYKESNPGSGSFILLSSLLDVMNTSTTNVFKKINASTYNNIPRNEITLDENVRYYYIVEYFDMDIVSSVYYGSSDIYLVRGDETMLLSEYITKDISNTYKNMFLRISEDKVLTYFKYDNTTYDVGFDIDNQQPYDNSNNDIVYYNKSVYCDESYVDKYVIRVDTNNVTTFVCPVCGNVKQLDDMYLLKDIYMVTQVDHTDGKVKFKCDISHNDDMINTHKKRGYVVHKLEFVENHTNPNRELNTYYIDLAKLGVDVAIARLYGDHHIVKYDETLITSKELDTFIVTYYNVLRYFVDVFDNRSLHIYSNYKNIVNFLVMVSTINKIIDNDYKNVNVAKDYTSRDARNMLYSYGIYELDAIPLQYQIDIIENITSLLKKRGSDSVITEILNMFTGARVNVYKYLMVKDYVRNDNGDIVVPTIYTEAELVDIINNGISKDTDYISVLERILNTRRSVFNKKYDNVDISDIKRNIFTFYTNFITNLEYDESASDVDNLNIVDNIKSLYVKYFKGSISEDDMLVILNSFLLDKVIEHYKNLSISNTYNYSEDDFRLLFLENKDTLGDYDYFDDYKNKYNEMYKSSMVEVYGDMSDRSFKDILITERENIMSNVGADSDISEELFDHPYTKQTEYVLIVNILGYVNKIKDFDIHRMKIIYENSNMEYVNNNGDLNTIKDVFISSMYDNIKNESFHKPITTNYLTWEGYIDNEMSALDIFKTLNK